MAHQVWRHGDPGPTPAGRVAPPERPSAGDALAMSTPRTWQSARRGRPPPERWDRWCHRPGPRAVGLPGAAMRRRPLNLRRSGKGSVPGDSPSPSLQVRLLLVSPNCVQPLLNSRWAPSFWVCPAGCVRPGNPGAGPISQDGVARRKVPGKRRIDDAGARTVLTLLEAPARITSDAESAGIHKHGAGQG